MEKVIAYLEGEKKKDKKPHDFFHCNIHTFCSIHLLWHQLHLVHIVYAVYMNIKREQVRKRIKCCQLVKVGDNQLRFAETGGSSQEDQRV